MQAIQVEIFDLLNARKKIQQMHLAINQPLILINSPGSIKTLGAVVIDYIFKTLAKEFVVEKTILRVDEDLAGFFTALELGYTNIMYTGNSVYAKQLLRNLLT